MFGISTARLVIYGIIAAIVLGGAFMLRHELIEKGKNLVYAEDNAALVKAQKAQIENDGKLVVDQKAYIDHLESKGEVVKENIRYVQAPCVKDGADDPRLGDVVDWLRRDKSANSVQAPGGPAAKGAVPPPRLPAATK